MLPAQQSKGYLQLYQMSKVPKIHVHIYCYQFFFSSSQSCLGDSVEYCGFSGNMLVKGDNFLFMNSSIWLYINLSNILNMCERTLTGL